MPLPLLRCSATGLVKCAGIDAVTDKRAARGLCVAQWRDGGTRCTPRTPLHMLVWCACGPRRSGGTLYAPLPPHATFPTNSWVRQIRSFCRFRFHSSIDTHKCILLRKAAVSTEAWGCSRLTVAPSSSPRARTREATTTTWWTTLVPQSESTRIVYN